MSGDRYIITDQNACHFLTCSVVDWVDVFTRPVYKQIVIDSLNFCIEKKGLTVFAWCLMTNHLHLVTEARPGFKLSETIRDFKKFTAYSILKAIQEQAESRKDWMLYRFEYAGKFRKRIEKYHFWQDGNHAVYMDPFKPAMLPDRIHYTHYNPVAAGIVTNMEDYLHSSARDYVGGKGLVHVELL